MSPHISRGLTYFKFYFFLFGYAKIKAFCEGIFMDFVCEEKSQGFDAGFHVGVATRAYEYFGAHRISFEVGKYVYSFRTFAARATEVELVSDFNSWGGTPLKKVGERGVWEIIYENLRHNLRIQPFSQRSQVFNRKSKGTRLR